MTHDTNESTVGTFVYLIILIITIIATSATSFMVVAWIGIISIMIGLFVSFVSKDFGGTLIETGRDTLIKGLLGYIIGILLVALTPTMPLFLQYIMYAVFGGLLPALSLASSLKSG